jgi:hypothetical protein
MSRSDFEAKVRNIFQSLPNQFQNRFSRREDYLLFNNGLTAFLHSVRINAAAPLK